MLERGVGEHAHSLSALLRAASVQDLLGPGLQRRVDRLRRAADVLRHTTQCGIEQLICDVQKVVGGGGADVESSGPAAVAALRAGSEHEFRGIRAAAVLYLQRAWRR